MGGHEERELSSVFQVLPQFALNARGIVSMRGWEMRWRILIMQSEGDEGGFCVVAESCHQTSEGIGLMASAKVLYIKKLHKYNKWTIAIQSFCR